mmetsp:Transcript_30514/g.99185  ORF Transcript_30514/g.99185 Transcript_30514/m.99185 type:complete len:242 (-) Transcript_30514:199-924(-)
MRKSLLKAVMHLTVVSRPTKSFGLGTAAPISWCVALFFGSARRYAATREQYKTCKSRALMSSSTSFAFSSRCSAFCTSLSVSASPARLLLVEVVAFFALGRTTLRTSATAAATAASFSAVGSPRPVPSFALAALSCAPALSFAFAFAFAAADDDDGSASSRAVSESAPSPYAGSAVLALGSDEFWRWRLGAGAGAGAGAPRHDWPTSTSESQLLSAESTTRCEMPSLYHNALIRSIMSPQE